MRLTKKFFLLINTFTFVTYWVLILVKLNNQWKNFEETFATYLGVEYYALLVIHWIGILLYFIIEKKGDENENSWVHPISIFFLINQILLLYSPGAIINGPYRNGQSIWYLSSVLTLEYFEVLDTTRNQNHGWPIITIFYHLIFEIFQITPKVLISMFEVLSRLLLIPFLYSFLVQIHDFFNLKTPDTKSIYFGIWFYLSLQFLDRVYFNIPVLTYLIFLYFMMLLFKQSKSYQFYLKSRFMIFYGSTLLILWFSHPATILLYIPISISAIIVKAIMNYKITELKDIIKENYKQIVLIIAGFLLFLSLIASSFILFTNIGGKIWDSLLIQTFNNPSNILLRLIPKTSNSTFLGTIFKYFIFSILIFTLSFKFWMDRENKNFNIFLLTAIIGVSSLSSVLITGYGANQVTFEIRSRIYIFLLPFFVFLLIMKSPTNFREINTKRIYGFLIIFLSLSSLLLHSPIYYSNERYTIAYENELIAADYIRDNFSPIEYDLLSMKPVSDLLVEYSVIRLRPEVRFNSCNSTGVIPSDTLIVFLKSRLQAAEFDPEYFSASFNNPVIFLSLFELVDNCQRFNLEMSNGEYFVYTV